MEYHSLCLLGKCGDDIMDEIISDLCGLVRNLIVVISVDSRFCSLKSSFITLVVMMLFIMKFDSQNAVYFVIEIIEVIGHSQFMCGH